MQDLMEAQGKAAERHSMRVQELEHQIVIAMQVRAHIFWLPGSAL